MRWNESCWMHAHSQEILNQWLLYLFSYTFINSFSTTSLSLRNLTRLWLTRCLYLGEPNQFSQPWFRSRWRYSAELHLHPPWWQRHCDQDPAISTSVTFPFGEKWALKYLFFQKYFPNQISLCYVLHFKLLIKVLRITLEDSNKLVINNFQTLIWLKNSFSPSYLSFVPYLP